MKVLNLITAITIAFFLTGCETMFAHIKLDNYQVGNLAKRNVIANTCASRGDISPDLAGEYNYWAALYLELTVIDEDHFKGMYDKSISHANQMNDSEMRNLCARFGTFLTEEIPSIRSVYINSKKSISNARVAEWQSISRSLNQVGNSARVAAGQTNSTQLQIPAITFKPTAPQTTEMYLVRTDSGLSRCQITSKNYMFCH